MGDTFEDYELVETPVDDGSGLFDKGDEQQAKAEPEPEVAQTADEDQDTDEASGDESTEKMVPVAAVAEQRRKAREARERNAALERELAYLKGRVEAQGMGQPASEEKEEEEEIDYTDIPGWMRRQKQSLERKFDQKLNERLAHEQGVAWQRRLAKSETAARGRYSDYDEKIDKFVAMAKANPALHQELLYEVDPAETAYQFIKSQTPPEDVERLRDKVRELEAKLSGKPAPKSLAKARGAGSTNKQTGRPDRDTEFSSIFAKG
jgi:hypothetical protein